MATDKNLPLQSPPNVLIVVAAVAVAIIMAIAAFIFGQSVGTGTLPNDSRLQEPAVIEPTSPNEGVACTMDAKLCPDGSAVGRMPPNCEFAPCPGE
jgi:hypothetical protein